MHAGEISGVAQAQCGQLFQSLFFYLTRQNRCPLCGANIPSFSFPRGKVPFSLPAWGESSNATPTLDYSLENRLYLFQFSLQIVFPCRLVEWNVLAQPRGGSEWCILGSFRPQALLNSYNSLCWVCGRRWAAFIANHVRIKIILGVFHKWSTAVWSQVS